MKRKFILRFKSLLSAFFISTIIFTSCDNINDAVSLDPTVTEAEILEAVTAAALLNNGGYITLSGSLDTGGAYPEQIAQSFISDGASGEIDSSRTAFPTFSTTGASLTYSITAKCGSKTFPGTISEDKKSYTVSIPVQTEAMTCTVEASILSGTTTLFSGESESFTISSENQVVEVPAISLKALSSAGNGSIELEIEVTGSGISYCTVKLDGEPIRYEDGSQKKFNAASNKITVSQTEVPAAVYTTDFSFYNSTDELIYKIPNEKITVISTMNTNTWVQNGNESWFSTSGTGSTKKTTCLVTADMVNGFALDEIYVADPSSAPDSLKTGSFFNPLTSFEDAIKKLNNSDKDYTIIIKGTLTGTQTIPDTLKTSGGTYNAKSLTIMGDTVDAKLDGAYTTADENNTVLNIKTKVPVTIKKLTITGGNCKGYGAGGGITISSCTYVTIGDGTKEGFVNVTGNTGERGAGIFCKDSIVTIKKYVKISHNEGITDGVTNSYGGGIYISTDNTKVYLEGGEISDNFKHTKVMGKGGGIYASLGKLYIYGDTIIKNNGTKLINGGGISNSEARIYLGYKDTDEEEEWKGSISGNIARQGGGIYSQASISMNSGEIFGNSANNGTYGKGGGLYIEKSISLTGSSKIYNNTASGAGGAIYSTTGSTFASIYMKDDAYIPAGADGKHDVYLDGTDWINIKTELTATAPIATITPGTYETGKKVLEGNTTALLESEYQKFAVTPKTGDSGTWTINSEGKLSVTYSVSAENLASVITGLPASDGVIKVTCTGGEVDYAALNTALKATSASKVSLDISNVSNTSLGNNTFSDCTKLYEIYLGTTSDTDFGYGVFLNCTNLAYIHLYKMESFKDTTFASYKATDVKLVLCPEGETVAVDAYCISDPATDDWFLVGSECKAAAREFTPAQFYKNGTNYKWVPVRG